MTREELVGKVRDVSQKMQRAVRIAKESRAAQKKLRELLKSCRAQLQEQSDSAKRSQENLSQELARSVEKVKSLESELEESRRTLQQFVEQKKVLEKKLSALSVATRKHDSVDSQDGAVSSDASFPLEREKDGDEKDAISTKEDPQCQDETDGQQSHEDGASKPGVSDSDGDGGGEEETMESLKATLARRIAQLENYATQFATLNDRLNETESELADARRELESTKASSSKQLSELQEKVTSLTDDKSVASAELVSKGKEYNLLQTELTRTKSNAAKLRKRMQMMQKSMASLEGNQKKLKEESTARATAQSLSSKLKEELEAARADSSAKAKRIKELTKSIEELKVIEENVKMSTAKKQDDDRKIAERQKASEDECAQLRNTLRKAQAEAGALEDSLRHEVRELRTRWKEAEGRNEDLAEQMGKIAQPLMRQIAVLQKAEQQRTKAWQAAESDLLKRVAQAEASHEISDKLVRDAKIAATSAEVKLKQATDEISAVRAEKQKNEEEKKNIQLALESLKEGLKAEESKCSSAIEELEHLRKTSKLEEEKLREELRASAAMHLAEKKKLQREVEKAALRKEFASHNQGTPQGPGISEDKSGAGGAQIASGNQSPNSEGGVKMKVPAARQEQPMSNQLLQALSIKESGSMKHFRSLQSAVRAERNASSNLRAYVEAVEKERDALSATCRDLSGALDNAQKQSALIEQMKEDHDVLQGKHDVLLELLGEKQENLELLQDDMEDMKTMYRRQTEDLLARIAAFENKK
eukprot:g1783.t1